MADLPDRLTLPLRRAGLDPVPLALTREGRGSVRVIGRILGLKVWLVTDHAQTRQVLNDPDYSTDIRALLGAAPHAGQRIGGLGFTDPPEHTALRKILTPEFTARRLAGLTPALERIVEDQLDVLAAAGSVVDFVADFAFPVPFAMICELLGLPTADQKRFQRLGHDRFDVREGGAAIFGAMSESRDFIREAISRQRRNPMPGNGLIATLLLAHGDQLDDDTIAGLADGVFTGGYETSASMLALGALALISDPGALGRIRADESSVEQVVEELLRYLSVVQIAFPRIARRDVELSDQRIRAGDVVICSLSRANRDEVFGNSPGSFDPNRASRPHLAFGHGFHRCIGAELARMQLRAAFLGLARRFPTMSLAVDPEKLEYHDLSIVYGLRALPVRLHADEPATPSPARPHEKAG